MNAKEFLDAFGADEAQRLAQASGTNLAYFRQIASGHRFPSRKLAEKLVKNSGGRLVASKLLGLS